jgi:competence protein ComEC
MDTEPVQSRGWAGLLLPGLLAFVAGTALQLQQAALDPWWVYMLCMLPALVAWSYSAPHSIANWRRTTALLLALALLGFGLTGLRAGLFLTDALAPELEGRDLAVTGVVVAMPQTHESGLRFRLAVASASWQGAPVRLPAQLDLSWYSGVFAGTQGVAELQRQPQSMQAGERWHMTVRLKAPHGGSNPHGFDYELWLWEQGVQVTGYVRTGRADPEPRRLGQTWWHPVERLRQQVREQIFAAVPDRAQAGLLAALVVGDQRAIERADWDVFRATGVAHLMSISGLHITMFAWAAALAVGWLWRRSGRLCLWLPAPHAALLGGVLLAAGYALFSGWGVPAQRTVLMLATVGGLRLSGKRWPWPVVWALACAVVVAADPWALLQAGFWLSFVAVGVLFASGDNRAEPSAPSRGSAAHAVASVGAMLREQWVITLALTPLTLLLFGQVSLVGLLANALAIPWVTLVITPLAMAGVVAGPLWSVAAGAVALLGQTLQWLAELPFAVLSLPQAPLWAGLVGLLGGVLLVTPGPRSLRSLGLPLLLPVLLWQAPKLPAGEFSVLAPDIGQGNAVLVRTRNHALVYDAGPRFSSESDAGHRVLVPLLRALGTTLDRVVLSHRDTDHVGGAAAVLAMQGQASLLSSLEPQHELQVQRPGVRCEAGQRWRWDGVDFEVLHPLADDYAQPAQPNALSCSLRISNGSQAALLVGDIEQAQEARLVASGVRLDATLLLVPHHGSKTSSSAAFLDAVQPRIAMVQAGYRNRFGHPAAPVLARYAARQIALVDSPHCGASTWVSNQPKMVQCQRRVAARYWHHRPP